MEFCRIKDDNIFLMCMDCGCRTKEVLRAAVGTKGFRTIPVEGVKGQDVKVVQNKQGSVWSKFSLVKKLDPEGGDPLDTNFLKIAAAHKKAGLL